MVISKEIRDRLVLLSAEAASQGRINEDAGYGIRIFEQLIEVVNMNQNPESLIDSLIS